MSGLKKTLVSFEVLEPKLPLTGSPGISRGDITATEVVMINKDVVGPSPITFEKADFLITTFLVLLSVMWLMVLLRNMTKQQTPGKISQLFLRRHIRVN